jgi:Tol biopolymer transport system component
MPAFSPDGHWLAYESGETGRFEIYVQPFPGPGRKWSISIGGGQHPIWAPKGRELFFLGLDQKIRVVDDSVNGDAFSAGTPLV